MEPEPRFHHKDYIYLLATETGISWNKLPIHGGTKNI